MLQRQAKITIALFAVLLSNAVMRAQSPPAGLEDFLRNETHLSGQEIGQLASGKAVGKVLPSVPQEVAVFGLVLVHAPADFFVERFRDIETYKKNSAVAAVKKFSNPPVIEDLAQLVVDDDDFNALKTCRPGSCAVKLPTRVMEQIHKNIPWNAPDARQEANRLARATLLEYVKRYLEGGNAELSEYNDKKKPLRVAEEFNAILQASPYIYDYLPQFFEYLRDYPQKRLDGVEDFIYWSREKFGLKPVISVTHVSIFRQPELGVTSIASKQIYASHYFEASLGMTAALVVSEDPNPAFYLLYFNRSRSDALHGGFSGLARGKVRGRSLSGLKSNLEKTKATIEAAYREKLAGR